MHGVMRWLNAPADHVVSRNHARRLTTSPLAVVVFVFTSCVVVVAHPLAADKNKIKVKLKEAIRPHSTIA